MMSQFRELERLVRELEVELERAAERHRARVRELRDMAQALREQAEEKSKEIQEGEADAGAAPS